MKRLILVYKEKRKRKVLPLVITFLLLISLVSAGVLYWSRISIVLEVSNPFTMYRDNGVKVENSDLPFKMLLSGGDIVITNFSIRHSGLNNDGDHKLVVEVRRSDGSLPVFNDTKLTLEDAENGRLVEDFDGLLEDTTSIPLGSMLNYSLFFQLRDDVEPDNYTVNITSMPAGDFNWKR